MAVEKGVLERVTILCQVLSRTLICILLQGRGIGRFMVARTVEFLKEEQIGNICLFADSDGELPFKVALAKGIGVRLQAQALFAMSLSHCDLVYWDSVSALSKPLDPFPAAVGFYQQLGFKADPDGVRSVRLSVHLSSDLSQHALVSFGEA